MPDIDDYIDDSYDFLHEVAHLSSEDLEVYYNEANMTLLSMLWDDLFEHPLPAIDSFQNFALVVSQLNNREIHLSHELGIALLQASDLKKQERINEGVEVLQNFIKSCASKGFREIAEIEKGNFEEGY
ncbi:MAG: hypothetical protein ACXWUF_19045 [Methylomagnum sp.]